MLIENFSILRVNHMHQIIFRLCCYESSHICECCFMCLCCVLYQPGLWWWRRSNQVLLHMFLVSDPCFPQRAGQLIANLIIGGLGRGHECHLAHNKSNMAGFLFHLPLKLNHFCAKMDRCRFA